MVVYLHWNVKYLKNTRKKCAQIVDIYLKNDIMYMKMEEKNGQQCN